MHYISILHHLLIILGDFRNSNTSHVRFGSILLQVDVAHRAVCGGAQAPSAPGEVLKMHDFLIWWTLFLCKCSGLDLDA